MGYYFEGHYDQHVIDRARWFFTLGYYQGKFALHMSDYDATKGIDMTSVHSFDDLNERLKGSLAINTLSQTIIKLDVAIEGLQRLMDDVKKLKEKLEEYK